MSTRTVSRRLQNRAGNTDRHQAIGVDPQFHTAGGNGRIEYFHTEWTTIGGGGGDDVLLLIDLDSTVTFHESNSIEHPEHYA